jgi:4-hydroxy-tetrahydrodipicolinate synthase
MLEIQMKDGFYPALGTPTDADGTLVVDSYEKQINLMIEAGAKGLLCMGSMGRMETIRNSEYPVIAQECCAATGKRVPVMVGVMDCSVSRVLDRIDALDKIDVEGVVATLPFYGRVNEKNAVNFFTLLAKESAYPVYIYDLPSVTQSPVTENVLQILAKHPNIKGIKTANLQLVLSLMRNPVQRDDFSVFYSNLDMFDLALVSGIVKNLDGMFTCTPCNTKKMYEYSMEGDWERIPECLNNILQLRNIFLKEDLLQAYSYTMGLLGCPGNYHPDYSSSISDAAKEEIYACMKKTGEIK